MDIIFVDASLKGLSLPTVTIKISPRVIELT